MSGLTFHNSPTNKKESFDPLIYDGFGRIFGLDMSQWPEKKVRFRKDN